MNPEEVKAISWALTVAQEALALQADEGVIDRRQSVNMIAQLAEIDDRLHTQTLRTLDAKSHPCRCAARHIPQVRRTHRHHILPLSWGGNDAPDNIVALCPSGHDTVHLLLSEWERAGRQLPRRNANAYLYKLAVQAWQLR